MVDLAAACVVAVLTRAPSSGGKTRLFADLGRLPDRALLEALLLDTIDGVAGDGWSRVVAVEPPESCDEVAALVPAGVTTLPQRPGTLGERMQTTIAALLTRGASAVALVGSDLPAIGPGQVARAFQALTVDPCAVVLGPAADGGFYLLAAARVPDFLGDVEWGRPSVLRDTIAAAHRAGVTVQMLDPLGDVDTVDDLRALCEPRVEPRHSQGPAERTVRWAHANVSGCGGTD